MLVIGCKHVASSIVICKSGFWKQNAEPLVRYIEFRQFGCFDASIIMRDRVEEYGSQGKMWVMAQHEESKNS